MRLFRSSSLLVTALAALLAACASSNREPVRSVAFGSPLSEGKRAADCSADVRSPRLTPLATTATSSAIALAGDADGRTLAVIADEDDKALHVLDVQARREIATVPLAGRPSHVLVARDGRVLVTLRDAAKVEVLAVPEKGDRAKLVSRCTIPTAAEPIAIAESPEADAFVVTSGWGHALEIFAHGDLALRTRVDLPREPRGVHIAADGKTAVVAHLLGSNVSVVDLATGRVRNVDAHGPNETRRITTNEVLPPPKRPPGSYPMKPEPLRFVTRDATIRRHSLNGVAFAMIDGKMVGPRVLVDPGERDERALYYGNGDRVSEISNVLLLDEKLQPITEPPRRVEGFSLRNGFGPESTDARCLLPRGITENVHDHTALVACLGSNTLIEYTLEAKRAVVRQSWPVGRGPVAVAYDARARDAIVWSQFDHSLTFVRLRADETGATRLGLARPQSIVRDGAEIELGRVLYHSTNDFRISRQGLACASCHPDGRDDALTWATQDGPRNAPMLAGRLQGTAPYAWNGTSVEVHEHLVHTVQRLGGSGLSQRELKALAAYCLSMKTDALRTPAAGDVARGKEIFESKEAQCSTCHARGSDNAFTDKQKHDVGSRSGSDGVNEYDTPSLRFVGQTAPYFHDGRYESLRELLTKTSGKMGKTSHLAPADLDALEAYLRTL